MNATMNTHADTTQESKSQQVANGTSQKQRGGSKVTFQFIDNRPEAVRQRKLQEIAINGSQAKQATQLQAMANHHSVPQRPIQKKDNHTGLPDNLKSGIENLSGHSMDDVKVHYNSSKPAVLQAHAYAQGNNIHLAPGQEKHLSHEAWHVVQQKQGRVKPTMQMKGNVNVNDDVGLEKEADVMGSIATQRAVRSGVGQHETASLSSVNTQGDVAQRVLQLGVPLPRLSNANLAKLADVIRIANAAHAADAAVTAANIDVTIMITSPARTEISPAETHPPVVRGATVVRAAGHDVTVDIQRAYLEIATTGELIGMIAHELGIHGYIDVLGAGGGAAPARAAALTAIPSVRPGRAATGYVMGQQGRHVSIDHLDATQALIGPAISARANKYVATILDHGNAIQADAHLTAAEKVTAQGELISSYAFDIARIVATDDRMKMVPFHWDAIREVYADAYTFLQGSAVAGAPWFAAAPLKPAADLKGDFNSMGVKFVWNKIKGR